MPRWDRYAHMHVIRRQMHSFSRGKVWRIAPVERVGAKVAFRHRLGTNIT
jgi:hypothetical protein